MNSGISTQASVTIEASVEAVWQALTTPELIKQWFFGVDTESDWTVGSSIISRSEWRGKPRVDKGVIVRIEPPTVLVHTHWSDQSGLPDRPESYQGGTWHIEERSGATELTVTERNLPSKHAKEASDQGWRRRSPS